MTTTDTSTGSVELFQGGGGLSFRYTPEEVQRYSQELLALTQSLLIKDTDYGLIPGTKRPSLYKPGAEKLAMIAGFAIHEDPRETRDGVTYRYTALRVTPGAIWVCGMCGERIDGIPVGQAEGYAGYDEDRFFQSAGAKRAKAEADEKHWAEKDQRAVRPSKWESVPLEEYRAPWNSVIKMAQKRGFVAAVLNAVAGSGLFTQDLEDGQPDAVSGAPYVPMDHLGPWLADLTKDELAELRAWRDREGLPTPREMTEAEAERVLVFIGTLMGKRLTGAGFAAYATQTGQETAPAPATAAQTPATATSAPASTGEPTGPEAADAAAIQEAEGDELSLDESPGAAAVAAFDAGIVPEPLGREAELQPGRAQHFHRKAGGQKLSAAEQEALIVVASEGRTTHASQLDPAEMAFAELLLTQLANGTQDMENLMGLAAEMVAVLAAK